MPFDSRSRQQLIGLCLGKFNYTLIIRPSNSYKPSSVFLDSATDFTSDTSFAARSGRRISSGTSTLIVPSLSLSSVQNSNPIDKYSPEATIFRITATKQSSLFYENTAGREHVKVSYITKSAGSLQ